MWGRWGFHRESNSKPTVRVHSKYWSKPSNSRIAVEDGRPIRIPENFRSHPWWRTAWPWHPTVVPSLLGHRGPLGTVTSLPWPPWMTLERGTAEFDFLSLFFPFRLLFLRFVRKQTGEGNGGCAARDDGGRLGGGSFRAYVSNSPAQAST